MDRVFLQEGLTIAARRRARNAKTNVRFYIGVGLVSVLYFVSFFVVGGKI